MNKLKTILLSTLAAVALASCGPKHVHNFVEKSTPATCTEDGVKEYVCSCGQKDESKTEIIPATGHNYELEETVVATCTTEGHKTYICTVCGDSHTEVIPVDPDNHPNADIQHTVATLDTPAYDTVTCECGLSGVINQDLWTARSVVQAFADQVFQDPTDSVQAATLKDGTEVRYTGANFADSLGTPAEAIELVTSVIFDELEGLDVYQGVTDDGDGGYYALYTYQSDYTFLAVQVSSYLNSTNTIIQVMSYVVQAA